ncbi:MAG: cyclic nucleotide-binding domain-containing protein [Lachnospiraceae bacterium]|jgi:CRP-like cAMP-binding protein|nr:cyclic nucleotide-binding domain-containing protein [Lachnospiraceae bacterium]
MPGIKMVQYSEGDVVLREGETNENLFKIINGHAEVYVGYGTENEALIRIIGEQSCFGELGMLLHKPSIYTVVAYSNLFVMQIPEDSFEEFVKTNHGAVLNLLRNTTETMLTFKVHIDLLLTEIEKGHKPDEKTLNNVKKLTRACGMYKSIDEAMRALKPQ